MISLIKLMVNQCIRKGYIDEGQAPWLQYSLECKISTILILIPFLSLGICLTSVPIAISFLFSFYFLRNYTNGYHASTVWQCLFLSLVFEVFFLGFLYRFIARQHVFILLLLSFVIIYSCAPFYHPDFELTSEEIKECKKIARRRTVIITVGAVICWRFNCDSIFVGLSLGVSMVALLLAIAYIQERRKYLCKSKKL